MLLWEHEKWIRWWFRQTYRIYIHRDILKHASMYRGIENNKHAHTEASRSASSFISMTHTKHTLEYTNIWTRRTLLYSYSSPFIWYTNIFAHAYTYTLTHIEGKKNPPPTHTYKNCAAHYIVKPPLFVLSSSSSPPPIATDNNLPNITFIRPKLSFDMRRMPCSTWITFD